ncbi:HNH endonuclease [Planctomycetes bacterium TBK1r]
MHRLILDFPLFVVDHRDRNGLNNVRENLRAATPWQNSVNTWSRGGTSRFVGVHWDKSANCWCVQIRHKRKLETIGYFQNEEAAAEAFDKRAIELRGEFAALNFPEMHGRVFDNPACRSEIPGDSIACSRAAS